MKSDVPPACLGSCVLSRVSESIIISMIRGYFDSCILDSISIPELLKVVPYSVSWTSGSGSICPNIPRLRCLDPPFFSRYSSIQVHGQPTCNLDSAHLNRRI